ncbi:MAG TPA: amidohydrolase, partial [Thermoanaerobaculia bacterium]
MLRALGALLCVPAFLAAQRPTLPATVTQYVAVDTPVVALTHVRVIDGTGAAPKEDQTLIIRDGNILAVGPARSTKVPDGAQVMDLTGKSVIPGLVMMHEHLYYPTGPGVYGADYVSFSRLYLAGGVTSMRTGGNVGGYADLNLAAAIKAGTQVGPWIDATAPYVNGPSPFTQMYALKDSADAR